MLGELMECHLRRVRSKPGGGAQGLDTDGSYPKLTQTETEWLICTDQFRDVI